MVLTGIKPFLRFLYELSKKYLRVIKEVSSSLKNISTCVEVISLNV